MNIKQRILNVLSILEWIQSSICDIKTTSLYKKFQGIISAETFLFEIKYKDEFIKKIRKTAFIRN